MSAVVLGLDSLTRKLRSLPGKVRGRITRRSLNAGGGFLRDEIRKTTPRITGALAESMRVDVKGEVATIGPAEGIVKTYRKTKKGKFRGVSKRKLESYDANELIRKEPAKYARAVEKRTRFFSKAVSRAQKRAGERVGFVMGQQITAAATGTG